MFGLTLNHVKMNILEGLSPSLNLRKKAKKANQHPRFKEVL